MKIVSTAFSENEKVPVKFTCDADNINPQLDISGIPEGTASLVLIVDDPDAPGGTWVHWTVWNIDPAATSILENSVPPKNRLQYLEIEQKLKDFSCVANIDFDELDLVLWSYKTGKVLK